MTGRPVTGRRVPEVVHVVVPAHDEELLLGTTLDSIERAAAAARDDLGIEVCTTVVLDACTDRSAEIAASLGVAVVTVEHRAAGAARRAGVDRVHAVAGSTDPAAVWVLTTDADTRVPEGWVLGHLRLATSYDVVVGAVVPDPGETPPRLLREWRRRHRDVRQHVHGANLGFRLSCYLAAGGFDPVAEHEDVRLVAAMTDAGARVGHGTSVLTSPRLVGRTPGGFAGFMAVLAQEIEAPGSRQAAGGRRGGP